MKNYIQPEISVVYISKNDILNGGSDTFIDVSDLWKTDSEQ